jgi:excisionase family DNA binding protein
MSTPTVSLISPAQAAHLVKVSRRTIMRAIDSYALKAVRNNKNQWKIDPSDLEKWASAQCAPSEHAHTEVPLLPTSAPTDSAVDLAVAQAQIDHLQKRLNAAEADRDRWQAMAEKLADRPRRNWWHWGRS